MANTKVFDPFSALIRAAQYRCRLKSSQVEFQSNVNAANVYLVYQIVCWLKKTNILCTSEKAMQLRCNPRTITPNASQNKRNPKKRKKVEQWWRKKIERNNTTAIEKMIGIQKLQKFSKTISYNARIAFRWLNLERKKISKNSDKIKVTAGKGQMNTTKKNREKERIRKKKIISENTERRRRHFHYKRISSRICFYFFYFGNVLLGWW